MDFITSYKRLEKLCGDLYENNRGISSYIEDMKTLPGYRHVSDWNEDLKQLKHYRQIRNQIVHEPDCSEETMCEPGDVEWLDRFYDRIMHQTDPLALYHQAAKPQPAVKSTRTTPADQSKPTCSAPSDQSQNALKTAFTWIAFLIIVIFLVVVFRQV